MAHAFIKISILILAALAASTMSWAVVKHAIDGNYCYAFFLAYPTYFVCKGAIWTFKNINNKNI